MNLCKNDCGFPENQYQQVINKESPPDKKSKISSRYIGKIKLLDGIWLELKNIQSDSIAEGNGNVSCLPTKESSLIKPNGFRIDCTQLGPIHRKSHQRIISIRNLFSNAPKFQKSFQRGVFLSCLIYSEDKILVTLDDVLPTFQIDEDLSSSFQNDFYWLHKISCLWNDVLFLKQEMEKCDSATALHFRLKLLQTIVTMQEALDLRDLGKVYYKPITTENNNVTFICTVNHLRSTKLVSAPNVRWVPLEKLKMRKSISDTYEVLSNSSQNLMIYHQMSNIPLGKGLYFGYFKLVTSVDLLKVIVPEKIPSIIPHVKIRNNSQVSKNEWELLTTLESFETSDALIDVSNVGAYNQNQNQGILTESQLMFRQQLDSSLKKLFSNLKIDRNSALNHRFYTAEVIEVSASVSFIILLPPVETACLLEGDVKDSKWMEESKLMTLPIQVFEMTHMLTYHNTLARRFMRLSATLEVETVLAQHNRRKAFSSEEMSQTQHQLSLLSNLQSKLESTWKDCRWLLEVVKVSRARDKSYVTLRDFLNRYNKYSPPMGSSISVNGSDSGSGSGSTGHIYQNLSPLRKFPKGTYVNAHHSPNKHQQLLLKTTQGGKILQVPLPGPSLPSNPNFKYESCSSLPIVSKTTGYSYEKLRSSASLFDMKMYRTSSARSGSTDGLITLSDNTNMASASTSGSSTNTNAATAMSVMQELDSYMRHTSSRSKLVNLSKSKFREGSGYGSNSSGGSGSSGSALTSGIPGIEPVVGLKPLSYTKQRGSLDRCFDLSLNLNGIQTCNLNGNDTNVNGSRERLLSVEEDINGNTNTPLDDILKSRVVEIYAAYDCGLSEGTCVKLQITSETSARQIVQLLIHKLNEEVKTKRLNAQVQGYRNESIDEFCLVSVIGARERVLRMDYRPLRLQRPWDAARLFVRKKNDVTAAVSLESSLNAAVAVTV